MGDPPKGEVLRRRRNRIGKEIRRKEEWFDKTRTGKQRVHTIFAKESEKNLVEKRGLLGENSVH